MKPKPAAQRLAKLKKQNAAALAAMTPQQRASNEADNAVREYVEALAAGKLEYDAEKFDALMFELYSATVNFGAEIGSDAVMRGFQKLMGSKAA